MESFEIINDSLSWPTRLSRTRISSVQGLGLSQVPDLATLNLDDVLRTVQHLHVRRCPFNQIENIARVGEGESFSVNQCIFEKDTVAVKHIKIDASKPDSHAFNRRLRAVLNEVRIMHHAPLQQHPNVLSLLGYGWQLSAATLLPYIVVEYASHGSLRQYLVDNTRELRTKVILAGDVASGLNALHQCGIVHGDLKLDNIVTLRCWDRPPGIIAKLCDFSHSIVLEANSKHLKYYGTELYNPPEVQDQERFPIDPLDLPKCDMWAYGLVLWEIFQDGVTFFKKSWQEDESYASSWPESLVSVTPEGSIDSERIIISRDSLSSSETSQMLRFGRFDTKYLSVLAIQFINSLHFGSGFVDKAILRKFISRALQVDAKDRPARITLGPLMSTWNPADVNTLHAKLSIHTGSSEWNFNIFNPDQEKEILWEHQLQIREDFEQIAKKRKSNDEVASAAFQVGMCYMSGFGVSKSISSAMKFFQEAEEYGNSAAKLFNPLLNPVGSELQPKTTLRYDTQIVRGLRTISLIDLSTTYVVRWLSQRSEHLQSRLESESRSQPPQYQDLVNVGFDGDIDETSTRYFESWKELRRWVVKCAEEGLELSILRPETSISIVKPSLKMNLLECAVLHEDTKLVRLLLKYVSISIPGYLGDLPLITACRTASLDMIRVCLSEKANPFQIQPDGSNFFHWIFMLGENVKSILDLLKTPVPEEDTKYLDIPCVSTKAILPQWPLQLTGSPLAFSVAAGSLDSVATLLRLGANPIAPIQKSDEESDKQYWTPLHLAVKNHSPEMIVLLMHYCPNYGSAMDSKVIASVKARMLKFPGMAEVLGEKSRIVRLDNTSLACATLHAKSSTELWDSSIGIALSYSTAVERIAIHGLDHENRLAETVALLPSSCIETSSSVGKTSLMQAIDFDDVAVVAALLKRSPELGSRAFLDPLDGQFTYPIHFASQIAARRDSDDTLEIMKTLVKYEPAHIYLQDSLLKTPLHFAVTGSSDKATRWLIAQGCPINAIDQEGQAALHAAQSTRNIAALLDAGIDVNRTDKAGRTPLHVNVSPGSEDLVQALVDRGADLEIKDSLGQTPLHSAIMRRSRDICTILLDAGSSANSQTIHGDTPLHLAVQSRRGDIVRLLSKHGAKVSSTNNVLFTPLHQSIVAGDYVCFNIILNSVLEQEPSLVNASDMKRRTPLHVAATFGCTYMAEELLHHGADASVVDEDGNNVFHLAVEGSHNHANHSQDDRVDFFSLLYSHLTKAAPTPCGNVPPITVQLKVENNKGQTPWDLAYELKDLMLMEFLLDKGGLDVCRQLQNQGKYIGDELLDRAMDGEEWDLVMALLRCQSVLSSHPKLKCASWGTISTLEMALRMSDKWSVKRVLLEKLRGISDLPFTGLEWIHGKITEGGRG